MAVVKIDHKKRIRKKTPIPNLRTVIFKSIIEFQYLTEGVQDPLPIVFVLSKKGKMLNGINLGYLKEYPIEKLLKESDFKRLLHYNLYEKAFRTYKISEMKRIKTIEWETSAQRRERKERERLEKKK